MPHTWIDVAYYAVECLFWLGIVLALFTNFWENLAEKGKRADKEAKGE
jgi:hypothetical protein